MGIKEYLKSLLDDASRGLSGVTERRMFGCDALFANLAIYALVWKTGRIGLRISEAAPFAELLAMAGSERWAPGGKPMAHWVLVPESFHDDPQTLEHWVRMAHGMAAAAGPKPATKGKRGARTGARLLPEAG